MACRNIEQSRLIEISLCDPGRNAKISNPSFIQKVLQLYSERPKEPLKIYTFR